jgi:hypothetical protein
MKFFLWDDPREHGERPVRRTREAPATNIKRSVRVGVSETVPHTTPIRSAIVSTATRAANGHEAVKPI